MALESSQLLTSNPGVMPEVFPLHPSNGEPSLLFEVPNLFYMNYMGNQTDMGAHHHELVEMAFVVGGTAIQRTTFGDFPCKPGDVYLILPGMWHAYAECRDFELYNCLLAKPLLAGPLSWALEDPSLGALLNPDPWHGSSQVLTWELPQSAIPKVREHLEVLLRVYSQSQTMLRGDLVGQLLILFDFTAHHGKPNYSPGRERVHSAVLRAAHALRNDLARPWLLPELAKELRINPSYLVRIFQQATGCAPMKFLARERAQKAAQLLLTSSCSVSEIGAKVGWDEPKQFARSFRQHFGESATEFRRRFLLADSRVAPPEEPSRS